jgi:hypothetical protein
VDQINLASSSVWNSCALYIKFVSLSEDSEKHCSTEIYGNERDSIYKSCSQVKTLRISDLKDLNLASFLSYFLYCSLMWITQHHRALVGDKKSVIHY